MLETEGVRLLMLVFISICVLVGKPRSVSSVLWRCCLADVWTIKLLHQKFLRWWLSQYRPSARVQKNPFKKPNLQIWGFLLGFLPATRRSLLGDRAFAVAGPRAWNSLPEFVTDCSSPLTFKKYLKTYLFSLSFRARFDCSSVCRLRCNSIKLHCTCDMIV